MTVEILRAQTPSRIDPNFEIALLFSLLGLTVTLALLPLLGSDFGTSLAMAG
jgi:hypothetical protein